MIYSTWWGRERNMGKRSAAILWKGKAEPLMLIDLLKKCNKKEHQRISAFLAETHREGSDGEAAWILQLMHKYKSIERARSMAKYMAGAALEGILFHLFFPTRIERQKIHRGSDHLYDQQGLLRSARIIKIRS